MLKKLNLQQSQLRNKLSSLQNSPSQYLMIRKLVYCKNTFPSTINKLMLSMLRSLLPRQTQISGQTRNKSEMPRLRLKLLKRPRKLNTMISKQPLMALRQLEIQLQRDQLPSKRVLMIVYLMQLHKLDVKHSNKNWIWHKNHLILLSKNSLRTTKDSKQLTPRRKRLKMMPDKNNLLTKETRSLTWQRKIQKQSLLWDKLLA